MEILLFISWGLSFLFSILSTIIIWKTKDKEGWNSLGFLWVGSILIGWALGIPIFGLMLYAILNKRFEDGHNPLP